MKVAVTGASGLIGSALCARLEGEGHQVLRLVRRRPGAAGEIQWDPSVGVLDSGGKGLEGLDAFIHLAGESIGAGRWTDSRKKAIVESRVMGTSMLVEVLAVLARPPKALLCASAMGFYGDRGGEELTEESPAGKGFLPQTCQAWEAACGLARKAGIRVVHLRTGLVLSASGGALARMLLPFQLGLGGRIGSGEQWMSWISLADEVSAILHALKAPGISGPVNLTAPSPVTNLEFTRALGKALGRPTFFPLPSFMVSLLFGEMGRTLLLESQRILPKKLERTGFSFKHPDLESALRDSLNGTKG